LRLAERSTSTAQFSVNPQRFDPYKNFKFRVKWDGRYVAGVSVGAQAKHEVVEHREGGDPSTGRKPPGRTKYCEAITLERASPTTPSFRARLVRNLGLGKAVGYGVRINRRSCSSLKSPFLNVGMKNWSASTTNRMRSSLPATGQSG
jgi:hypothetical protein